MPRPKTSPTDKISKIRRAIERGAGSGSLTNKTDKELLAAAQERRRKLAEQQRAHDPA